MQLREDYPYHEAIRDLKFFFDKQIKNPEIRAEFDKILDACFEEKTVAMRGIHEKFIRYLKEHHLYEPYTSDEEKMMSELLHFWT